jgi:hypothetical protein
MCSAHFLPSRRPRRIAGLIYAGDGLPRSLDLTLASNMARDGHVSDVSVFTMRSIVHEEKGSQLAPPALHYLGAIETARP